MRGRTFVAGVLAFITVIATGGAGSARDDASASAPAAEPIAALLERVRTEHDVPAMSMVIVKDGTIGEEVCVGVRSRGDDTAVQPGDTWHIGSCTKSMTATLAAMLVAEGLLQWETTIAQALPDLVDDINPAYHDITLRELLLMRGGVPGQPPPDAWMQAWKAEGPVEAQRRQFVRDVLTQAAPKSRGTLEYSNQSYTVAALMCEAVSGKTYETLLVERLGRPLGMTSLGFGPPGLESTSATEGHPVQPYGHQASGTPVPPGPAADNPPAITPAGRAHVTLTDWAKYARAHLDDDTKGLPAFGLDAANATVLHTPGTRPDGATAPRDNPYAMGWLARDEPFFGRTLWHNGSNTMWYAEAWLAPEKDLAILVACNQGGDNATRAVGAVLKALKERVREEKGSGAPADKASTLE